MTNNRKILLENLLRPLVAEWGYETVEKTLAQLLPSDDPETRIAPMPKRGRLGFAREPREHRRSSALEQVAKASILEDRRQTLEVIATKFDQKEFLPTISDIREFLALTGTESTMFKDRSDGFRRVLTTLNLLPPDRLERLARGNQYSGPSRLGPLSDAIRAAGRANREDDENAV